MQSQAHCGSVLQIEIVPIARQYGLTDRTLKLKPAAGLQCEHCSRVFTPPYGLMRYGLMSLGGYIFLCICHMFFWLYYTNCYPIYCSSHDQPGIPPLTNKSNETRLRVVASYMPSCCLQFQHASACFSSPSQGVRITFLKFFGQEERRVWLPRPYFDLYIVYISILLNRIEPNLS